MGGLDDVDDDCSDIVDIVRGLDDVSSGISDIVEGLDDVSDDP